MVCIQFIIYIVRSTRALRRYFELEGIDQKPIWDKTEDIIIKTLIAVEERIHAKMSRVLSHRFVFKLH
jgi:hypothetical protein